jgi:hypothetical protein
MIRGRLIAESLRAGSDIQIDGMRLVPLGRHDVTTSTLPTNDRREDQAQHGSMDEQPRVWTFVDIEAPSTRAAELAQALADTLEPELGWWADFIIDDVEHVVTFAGQVFRYRIGDEAARAEAVAWGRSVGTPEHKLDWGP